jgi:hypothetical protein
MENRVNTTYGSYQGMEKGNTFSTSIRFSWEISVSQVLPFYQTGNQKVTVTYCSAKESTWGSELRGRIVSKKYLREKNTFNMPVLNQSLSIQTDFAKESEERKTRANMRVQPPFFFLYGTFSLTGIPSAVGDLRKVTREETGWGDFCPNIQSQKSEAETEKKFLALDLFHSFSSGLGFGFWAKAFRPVFEPSSELINHNRHAHGITNKTMELF